ncbi:uncharacterized protein MYCFIDRAFT_172309 [Pseudocercospora fijiensis CIRAD86]|uniref:Uncharacterized protein n=1 Tax=Pseudocercospora fijiensis (strain CIRAD86) TaxID=383855 RepID=M3BBJ1_PSEFD|nr:uncharacterized protein MYCFIDRAFT_172309 [Pseudocercospora fijiensis CIRAD86]EME86588.1 hypothetical protein MYCFIDRAFT_172309 [Pseudocercospora fijiensis CIRAD86]
MEVTSSIHTNSTTKRLNGGSGRTLLHTPMSVIVNPRLPIGTIACRRRMRKAARDYKKSSRCFSQSFLGINSNSNNRRFTHPSHQSTATPPDYFKTRRTQDAIQIPLPVEDENHLQPESNSFQSSNLAARDVNHVDQVNGLDKYLENAGVQIKQEGNAKELCVGLGCYPHYRALGVLGDCCNGVVFDVAYLNAHYPYWPYYNYYPGCVSMARTEHEEQEVVLVSLRVFPIPAILHTIVQEMNRADLEGMTNGFMSPVKFHYYHRELQVKVFGAPLVTSPTTLAFGNLHSAHKMSLLSHLPPSHFREVIRHPRY